MVTWILAASQPFTEFTTTSCCCALNSHLMRAVKTGWSALLAYSAYSGTCHLAIFMWPNNPNCDFISSVETPLDIHVKWSKSPDPSSVCCYWKQSALWNGKGQACETIKCPTCLFAAEWKLCCLLFVMKNGYAKCTLSIKDLSPPLST